MTKIITAVAVIALAVTAMGGAAYAKPGKGGNGATMIQPGNIYQYQPGSKAGKAGQPGGGGDIASPGDAFYPDAGDEACDGVLKRQFDDAGILQLVCVGL